MEILAALRLASLIAGAGMELAEQIGSGKQLLAEKDEAKAKEALAALQAANDALYAATQALLANAAAER